MKTYAHLREKARTQRHKGATLTTICEQLALSKSTVYYWIEDIPIPLTARQSEQRKRAARAVRKKYEAQRRQWYDEAHVEAAEVLSDPLMRDFVALYAAEGFKRDRNRVEICNSNPGIMRIAYRVITKLTRNSYVRYRLQCHVDNDERKLKRFWAGFLDVSPTCISVSRKSNAGGLSGRRWRSENGVLTVEVGDTQLRCKIQAWMDYLQQAWLQA